MEVVDPIRASKCLENMDWITVFVLVFCTCLFLSYVCKNFSAKTSKRGNKETLILDPGGTSSSGPVCNSPNCVRCQSRAYDAHSIKNQLMQSFKIYVVGQVDSHCSQEPIEGEDHRFPRKLQRILHTINSIDEKVDILESVYREACYKFEPSFESQPHIWWMPGLKRSPFWETTEHPDLKTIATVFESPATIKFLQQEYEKACTLSSLWKQNKIQSGKWELLHFYDQGDKNTKTCDVCPHTVRLLESVSDLMMGCVYGNAMISVLGPGSQIEAHTGPCNFRLRCHLALVENKNCGIQVGSEVKNWEQGKLMVFDDSFVHRVWHETSLEGSGNDRVVLIFDVWHPEVNHDERQLLNHLFPSPHKNDQYFT